MVPGSVPLVKEEKLPLGVELRSTLVLEPHRLGPIWRLFDSSRPGGPRAVGRGLNVLVAELLEE